MASYISTVTARLHAAGSSLVTLLAIGVEATTVGLECQALLRRQAAYSRGQAALTAYDADSLDCALYYLPSTDVASQPGGIGSTALWHLFNIIALLFVLGSEVPTRVIMDAWKGWAGPFGPRSSPIYAGSIQILVGSSILATPAAIYGSLFAGFRLYAAGWPLIAFGVTNVLPGILYGQHIRALRGQADDTPASVKPAVKCEEIRQELIRVMEEVTYSECRCSVSITRWSVGRFSRRSRTQLNFADALEVLF